MTLDEKIVKEKANAEKLRKIIETGYDGEISIEALFCDDTATVKEVYERFENCAKEHEQIAECLEELKELREENKTLKALHEGVEKQGLLLWLPIAEGTTVYTIENNTDACTDDCKYFNVGYCCEDYCSKPNVEDDVYPQHSDKPICEKQYFEVSELKPDIDWIFRNRDNFGKTVFLNQAEAKQKLKEMGSV